MSFGHGPGRVRLSAATALLAVVAMAAGCSGDDDDDKPGAGASGAPVSKGDGPSARVKMPDGCTTTLDAETPAQVAVAVSQALFTGAPVVVVGPAEDGPALQSAISAATAAAAPLLVTDISAAGAPSVDASASPTTASSTEAVSFESDTADCAAPPPEVTPSAAPSSTSSPSAEPTEEAEEDDSEESAEPTTTASPAITPAAYSVAMAGATACLDEAAADEPADEPTAEPTGEPTATASATSTASADPSQTPTTDPTPASLDVDPVLDPNVAAEIKRLEPESVLATDPAVAAALRDGVPGLKVVENASDLPETSAPDALSGLSVLLPDEEDLRAGALAAQTTAAAAGADAVGVTDGDPRAGECAVQALFKAKPTKVLVSTLSSLKKMVCFVWCATIPMSRDLKTGS